jgi:UDP-2,3-diacylglucosamine pyrophosphatase LpxH
MNVRSAFLSDVHLGYRGCRAEALLEFLHRLEARNIFIIGDLVDFWALRRALYWPKPHQDVLKALLAKAQSGTRVVYVPGNHDDLLRDFCGMRVLNVDVRRRLVHRTADGRRMLVIHGDEFDDAVRFSRFRRALGAGIYDGLLRANHSLDRLRRAFGFGEWSLTAWIKHRVADARRYIARFEEAAANAAERAGCDGVICGHLHHPAVRDIDGVLYCNDGDWVENCTALVEDFSGRLSILRWTGEARAGAPAAPGPVPARAAAALAGQRGAGPRSVNA